MAGCSLLLASGVWRRQQAVADESLPKGSSVVEALSACLARARRLKRRTLRLERAPCTAHACR
ncbi:hypothetical protein PF005_g23449 [Phytophthora fragariae]|uniref:Uncharacterized protein n=1 Tax=Phytophthora fragariae TaxID=53985 RepID=A0A6A3QPH9_9STRA|nr:hypothetical protein PF003_g25083 [Phytophthora fragariae]KAE8925588.1 hypothetical protein PF009_g24204 [Phytophthora fragariae]KAE9079434.1 hypothetical protein PF007_g23450 [Phytophthora fragariae]KAE9079532.1 hypothetical protein PF010_g22722 [Phytophthora fragariae]KAE9101791.1 hypothetical protein PF006_g22595 [Phytophthora fragariae]